MERHRVIVVGSGNSGLHARTETIVRRAGLTVVLGGFSAGRSTARALMAEMARVALVKEVPLKNPQEQFIWDQNHRYRPYKSKLHEPIKRKHKKRMRQNKRRR